MAAKPSLLLLPGMDGTGLLFHWLVTRLSGIIDASVIAYPPGMQTYLEMLQHAEKHLLSSEPTFLLGESFSGPVAIQLAYRYPERVRGLILAASFAKCPSPLLHTGRHILSGKIPAFLMHRAAILLRAGFHDREIEIQLTMALNTVSSAVLIARLRQVASVDVTDQLERLQLPILYLRAGKDRLVPRAAGQLVQQCAAQTTAATLNAPHLLLQYASEGAATAILQFIDQHAHHHA